MRLHEIRNKNNESINHTLMIFISWNYNKNEKIPLLVIGEE